MFLFLEGPKTRIIHVELMTIVTPIRGVASIYITVKC